MNDIIDQQQPMTEAPMGIPNNLLEVMMQASFQNPRNEHLAMQNAIKELEVVPGLAGKSYYSIPYNQGRKNETRVEGISIRGSQALSRFMRNNITAGKFINEDNSYVYVEGIYYDIENNIIKTRPMKAWKFYTPKGTNRIEKLDATMLRNATNSAISKAIRNATLDGIPEWIKTSYFDMAKQLVLKPVTKGKSVKSVQERIVDGKKAIVKDFSVTHEELEDHLQEHAVSFEDDNAVLLYIIDTYKAFKDGDSSPKKVFGKNHDIQEPQAKKK